MSLDRWLCPICRRGLTEVAFDGEHLVGVCPRHQTQRATRDRTLDEELHDLIDRLEVQITDLLTHISRLEDRLNMNPTTSAEVEGAEALDEEAEGREEEAQEKRG